jgi:hypothetical protein
MSKLFYVVEKELHGDGYCEEVTGNKQIRVYDIDTQAMELIVFCEIETLICKNSESEIQTYLDNNGYEDEFEFVEL